METMKIGLLIVCAVSCLGGSIYGAFLGVILHKNSKRIGSAILFSFSIVLIILSILLLIAI